MSTSFSLTRNNASSIVGPGGYTAGSGSLPVRTGDGALFGPIAPGQWLRITVIRQGQAYVPGAPATSYTIYRATGIAGDTLTGLTTIEGTSDRSYAAGDVVEVRVTGGTIGDLQGSVNTLETYATTAEGLYPEGTVCLWGDSTAHGGGPDCDGGRALWSYLQDAYPNLRIVNEGVGGETSALTLQRLQARPARWPDTAVFLSGRNDLANIAAGYTTVAQVLANIRAMVNTLGHNRYLVCAPWNMEGEGTGTTIHDSALVPLKAALAAEFGPNYFDAHAYLISQASSGAADQANVAAHITPVSLRMNPGDVHLNSTGNQLLATQFHGTIDAAVAASAPAPVSQQNLLAAVVDACARPQWLGSAEPAPGSFEWLTVGTTPGVPGAALLHLSTVPSGAPGIIVQVAASGVQAGNALEVLDPASNVLFGVNPAGNALNVQPAIHFSAQPIPLRVYEQLASYSGNAFGQVGAFVVRTPFTAAGSTMVSLKVRGFIYDVTSPFELVVSGYLYADGNVYNAGYINFGSRRVRVRLGKLTAGGQLVLILGDVGDSWNLPQLWVDSVMQGFSSVNESYAARSGWSLSQETDLAPYSGLTDVPDVGRFSGSPTITGARGGNAALADMLTKGAALGLWTDGTTP